MDDYQSENEVNKSKLGDHAFVTKLAGFEHSKYIQYNATHEMNDVPLLMGGNVKNGRVVYEFDWYIPQAISDALPRSVLNKKCLVIPYVGSKLGELAIFENKAKCHLGSNIAKVEMTSDTIQLEYLYYYLKSSSGQTQLFKDKQGSAQPNITMDSIRNTLIAVPTKAVQQKIAAVLSALDAKIDLNNRINAELEAMAKTLYDYWFVQFDFPDDAGKPYKSSGGKMVWNEELKREVPEGWEVVDLTKIANITMGQSPEGESYNDTGDGIVFYQGSTDFGWRFPTVRQFTTSPTRFAKQGNILLSVRAPVGTLNVAGEDCCIGRGLAALNSKQNAGSFLFGTMVLLKQIFDRRNADGTTFGSITKDDLYSLKVVLPTKDVLLKYEAIVSPQDEMIFKTSQENQQLTQLRDWLLPMLMNGQVQVAAQTKTIELPAPDIAIAAEPEVAYGSRTIPLPIPRGREAFAKRVLGGKVVSLFKDDPHFSHIKFQKVQFLADMLSGAALGTTYYIQAAGPYDPAFMHTVAANLKASGWFEERAYKWHPLTNHESVEGYYKSYFAPALQALDKLFSLLADKTEEEAEIIATLYAVWNNRIILHQPISDDALITDFYNWSERKHQYKEWPLTEMLAWMIQHEIVPVGAGKGIKAKSQKVITSFNQAAMIVALSEEQHVQFH